MDHAVSLVQAYLQLNGYFTSAEYPIIASAGRNGFRTLTDIDILAFRFPTGMPIAPSEVPSAVPVRTPRPQVIAKGLDLDLDPGLGVPEGQIDFVIGEVKEGRVGINSGARDPEVLKTVVGRFGPSVDRAQLVQDLLETGVAVMPTGYQVRMVAFGAFPPGAPIPPCRIISLGHVLRFLQDYVRRHWNVLRHCQFKDPAFGFLMTMEKARRGGAGRRGQEGVEVVTAETEKRLPRPRPASTVGPQRNATPGRPRR